MARRLCGAALRVHLHAEKIFSHSGVNQELLLRSPTFGTLRKADFPSHPFTLAEKLWLANDDRRYGPHCLGEETGTTNGTINASSADHGHVDVVDSLHRDDISLGFGKPLAEVLVIKYALLCVCVKPCVPWRSSQMLMVEHTAIDDDVDFVTDPMIPVVEGIAKAIHDIAPIGVTMDAECFEANDEDAQGLHAEDGLEDGLFFLGLPPRRRW